MKVTKPGTVEVSEGKIAIDSFDFESDGEGSYYEAAKAACEWAKDEMDRQLEGCFQLDSASTYIVANPIVCDAKPIEDKTPYYRKFERNRK
jgi:hypothetical protein